MKKLTSLIALAAIVGLSFGISQANADLIVDEDCSSFTDGDNIGSSSDWNVKWDGTDTSQQNLFVAESGTGTIDYQIAKSQYRAIHQTGFSLQAGDTATIETEFRFTHNGQGNPTDLNENFFGMQFTTGPAWWQGDNQEITIANRGAAIGNRLPFAPWIQNWVTQSSLGVDTTGGVDSTSNWIDVTVDLYVGISGNYEAVLSYAGATATAIDLGSNFAAGTTIYAGITSAWDGSGGTKADHTHINGVAIDNFRITVDAIPEPTGAALLIFGFAGAAIRRKK